MWIRFTHTCGKQLRAEAHLAGKRVRCTKCGEVTVVPDQAGAEEARTDETAPTPRRPRVPSAVWLGLAGFAVVLLLAGAAYWWLWLPSGAEEAIYKDYLRSGNELVEMHAGLEDRAAEQAARPRLRAKAQENLEAWQKVQALSTRKQKALKQKYQAETAQLHQRFMWLAADRFRSGGARLLVIWGRQSRPGTWELFHKNEAGPYSVVEFGGTTAASRPAGAKEAKSPGSTPPAAAEPDIEKRLRLRSPFRVAGVTRVVVRNWNEAMDLVAGAKLGSFTFPEACTVIVQRRKDGTVLAQKEGVIATDDSGKGWKSRKAKLDGNEVFLFFADETGPARRGK
jgi:hypothetical protein